MYDLRDVQQAFVRGSHLIGDYVCATIPDWSAFDDGPSTGQMLLDAFDAYADEQGILESDAVPIRKAIIAEWWRPCPLSGASVIKVDFGNGWEIVYMPREHRIP